MSQISHLKSKNMYTLKTAFRSIKNNKLMTFINVLSLAIGISATLIIFLFVQYDYSFDKHVPDKERVYRIISNGTFKIPGVMVPLVNSIETELTNQELVAPIFKTYLDKILIPETKSEDQRIFNKDNKLVFTNSKYFDFYPHTWLAGNANELNKPNGIILSDVSLKKYFPKDKPDEVIGKTIVFIDSINLTVKGVVKEMSENSDFKFQSFISTNTIPVYPSLKSYFAWDSWNNYNDNINALIKLPKDVDPKTMEKELLQLVKKYKKNNDGFDENFTLQPLSDIHFNADFNYNATKPGTLRNLIILAIFLLSLGLINFVNLSTAQSSERAKEIGIRKTLGSTKSKLSKQFLTETFLIALTATILSIIITPILLKAFVGFVPGSIKLYQILSPIALAFLIGQLVLVTLLAGLYPAWVMTGYSPVLALKNQISKNSNLSRSSWIRKALTVFQFVLAQVFLICVVVVVKQTQHLSKKELGFDKDAIINFYIPGSYQNSDKGVVLKNKIAALPDVQSISFGNHPPATLGMMTTSITLDGSDNKEGIQIDMRDGDENFINVYKIPLVAGRNVILRDSTSEILINQQTLEKLNFKTPEEAIGKTLNDKSMTIVGVMKDFDISSVKRTNAPLIYIGKKQGYVMHIRLDKNHPETWKSSIDKISKEFKTLFPTDDFEYTFLDETIGNFYKKELQLAKLLTWAVGLSIFIAGLGLFGLAIFTANQRTKEIGIRKVLGATVLQIINLLLKNLLILVGIACLIAFPVSWYFSNKWLNDFSYKTDISWWIFPLSAFSLLLIATLVLLSKSYFAAKANPVDSIRNE